MPTAYSAVVIPAIAGSWASEASELRANQSAGTWVLLSLFLPCQSCESASGFSFSSRAGVLETFWACRARRCRASRCLPRRCGISPCGSRPSTEQSPARAMTSGATVVRQKAGSRTRPRGATSRTRPWRPRARGVPARRRAGRRRRRAASRRAARRRCVRWRRRGQPAPRRGQRTPRPRSRPLPTAGRRRPGGGLGSRPVKSGGYCFEDVPRGQARAIRQREQGKSRGDLGVARVGRNRGGGVGGHGAVFAGPAQRAPSKDRTGCRDHQGCLRPRCQAVCGRGASAVGTVGTPKRTSTAAAAKPGHQCRPRSCAHELDQADGHGRTARRTIRVHHTRPVHTRTRPRAAQAVAIGDPR